MRAKKHNEYFARETDISGIIRPRDQTVSFVGLPTRTVPVPVIRYTLEKTLERLIRKGYTQFMTGINGQFERTAGEVMLQMKSRYPEKAIALVLVISNYLYEKMSQKPTSVRRVHRGADAVIVMGEEAPFYNANHTMCHFLLSNCKRLCYSRKSRECQNWYPGLSVLSQADSTPELFDMTAEILMARLARPELCEKNKHGS